MKYRILGCSIILISLVLLSLGLLIFAKGETCNDIKFARVNLTAVDNRYIFEVGIENRFITPVEILGSHDVWLDSSANRTGGCGFGTKGSHSISLTSFGDQSLNINCEEPNLSSCDIAILKICKTRYFGLTHKTQWLVVGFKLNNGWKETGRICFESTLGEDLSLSQALNPTLYELLGLRVGERQ